MSHKSKEKKVITGIKSKICIRGLIVYIKRCMHDEEVSKDKNPNGYIHMYSFSS